MTVSSGVSYVLAVQATMTTTTEGEIAQVLRRCGFVADPAAVRRWSGEGTEALIDWLLDQPLDQELPNLAIFRIEDDDGDYEVKRRFVMWWLDQMVQAQNPLHERLTWYWHTHFTSSLEQVDAAIIWDQHRLVRAHALGSFRRLAREITTDAAMLVYLDGDGSRGEEPNENHARELLELFMLGLDGGWTEDDVRAAARIMSGWSVDRDTGVVEFDPERSYQRPVTFMGERRRWSIDEFIDFVVDQQACARHVAARLYRHLVGADPDGDRLDELATVFRDADLEIRPLVAAIISGPNFLDPAMRRARQPVEWLVAARHAAGIGDDQPIENWHLEQLGQVPLLPPNVAGWPLDDRWAGAAQVLGRTAIALDWELSDALIDHVEPTADAVLRQCGIHDETSTTRQALDHIEAEFSEYDGRLELLFATALVSPEFMLL